MVILLQVEYSHSQDQYPANGLCSGTWSTYLGTYFSVRARALSSLISPFFCIIGCFGLGFILDMKKVNQRRRAQTGLVVVVILNLGVYIWSIVMQVRFNSNSPGKIDWDDSLYARSFLPYFFVQTTGPLSQFVCTATTTTLTVEAYNDAGHICTGSSAASPPQRKVRLKSSPSRIYQSA